MADRKYPEKGRDTYSEDDIYDPNKVLGPGHPRKKDTPTSMGAYAKKGRDFPRRDILLTPQDELYNPNKILGGKYGRSTLTPTGRMVSRQARIETEALRHTQENILPSSIVANQPFETNRRQDHLDLSRYAEVFYMVETVVLPPAPIPPLVPPITPMITFDTYPTMRTIIRWIDLVNFDGLAPSGITVDITLQGDPVKVLCQYNNPATHAIPVPAGFPPQQTVVSPTAIDIDGLPIDFHNTLLEVADRQTVSFRAVNTLFAARKVQAAMWGWIEPITRLSESVHK
jgi:hypothetical protein